MESKYLVKYRGMDVSSLLDSIAIISNAENNADIFHYCIACKEKAQKADTKTCDMLLNIVDKELSGLYNIGFLKTGHFRILEKHGIHATVLWNDNFYIPAIEW